MLITSNIIPRYGIIVTIVNAIFSSQRKGDGTVYTWKVYWDKVFGAILRKHPSASIIIAMIIMEMM